MSKTYQMGIDATLAVIGSKWKPIILCHLGHYALRAGELKRRMPEISQKVLTQQLRELEKDAIISRESYNQVPPKVVYSLTNKGRSLKNVLITMSLWGDNFVKSAQENGEDITLTVEEFSGYHNMCQPEE